MHRDDSGDLQALVDEFVDGVPRRGSDGHAVPTEAERDAFMRAVDRVLADDAPGAADLLDPLEYDVVRYTDTVTGQQVLLLQERQQDGSPAHGWGLYGFGRAESPLVVEVPHPVHDVDSERVGLQAFRVADARAVLVAGAHRYANGTGDAPESDMAHRQDSVFHAVHRRLLRPGLRVLQPHGFGDDTRQQVGHDVVVSSGAAATSVTRRVTSALTDAGFLTCLYDGDQCWQLAATGNVQGRSTRGASGEFVHVESHTSIRRDARQRDLLARTLGEVLR